jgi:hypothetical protein
MTSISPVRAQPSKLRQTSIKEYGLRFVFGGVVTAAVGIVATVFGPNIAGLFLAFPAILMASLTLISKHEDRPAAGSDALGACAGSIGLLGFGAVVWALASRGSGVTVLGIASVVWLAVSVGIWAAGDAWRRRGRETQ